jgi:hypothetical protein
VRRSPLLSSDRACKKSHNADWLRFSYTYCGWQSGHSLSITPQMR